MLKNVGTGLPDCPYFEKKSKQKKTVKKVLCLYKGWQRKLVTAFTYHKVGVGAHDDPSLALWERCHRKVTERAKDRL